MINLWVPIMPVYGTPKLMLQKPHNVNIIVIHTIPVDESMLMMNPVDESSEYFELFNYKPSLPANWEKGRSQCVCHLWFQIQSQQWNGKLQSPSHHSTHSINTFCLESLPLEGEAAGRTTSYITSTRNNFQALSLIQLWFISETFLSMYKGSLT